MKKFIVCFCFVVIGFGILPTANATIITVDPDAYSADTILNDAFTGVALTAIGSDLSTNNVYSRESSLSSTGNNVFGHSGDWDPSWWGFSEILKVDFLTPTNFVSVDVIADDTSDDGWMEAYDSLNNLLIKVNSSILSTPDFETLSLTRSNSDISYVLISGNTDSGNDVLLDNLKYNYSTIPEPTTMLLFGFGLLGLTGVGRRKK